MKDKFLLLVALASLALPLHAAPLTESTFTEIVNEVNALSAAGAAAPAKVNDVLKAPQRVRTGPQSRAELIALDNTITRVGANTIFSYADSGRTLNLEQGSLLFHAPKGLGGGTIKSGGAAAAVLGTTVMTSSTPEGGLKVILLEGKGQVTLPNGKSVILTAGQEVFVLPGGTAFSPVFSINLDKLVGGSLLVKGFSHELSSMPLILVAIQDQNSKLKSGANSDTGQPPEFFLPPPAPGNGQNVLDPATTQTATHPPLTPRQFNALVNAGQGPPPGNVGPGGRTIVTLSGPRG